jgi:hypothetical protein
LNVVDVFTIASAVIILGTFARRLSPIRRITLFRLALLSGAWNYLALPSEAGGRYAVGGSSANREHNSWKALAEGRAT